MKKTINGNIEEIEKTLKENGGTAVIATENHNGNGKNEKEENAKIICIANIIKSIIAGIEVKKAKELEEKVIAEESTATISCNGTKLSIYLNQNGNDEDIKVEAEIATSITSRHFFLTRMLLEDNKKNINPRMIQRALEENPELFNACKNFFFPQTIIKFTTNQQPS